MYSFFRAPVVALAALVAFGGTLPAASNLVIASSDGGVFDYLAATRNFIRSWVVAPGITKIIPSADGQKVYVLAAGPAGSIAILKRDFTDHASPDKSITNLVTGWLTPDGSKLVVLTGTNIIRVFKTADDSEITVSNPSNLNTITDTAISADSRYLYIFSGQGTAIYTLDLNTLQVIKNVPVAANSGTLQRAPNGFLYLATNKAVLELDPLSLATRKSIAFQGTPIRLAFTPDGNTAYTVDPSSLTGAALSIIDLNRHSVSTLLTNGFIFQKLVAVSNTRLFGLTGDGHLYNLVPSSFVVAEAHFSDQANPYTSVIDLVTTAEVPAPQTMYVVRTNRYSEIYLPTDAQIADLPMPGSGTTSALAYLRDTQSGTPYRSIAFGANQTLASGAAAAPIGVRILNSAGLPLRGIAVQFSTTQTGASLSATSVNTDIDGYAYTALTPPATSATFNVTSAVPSVQNTFIITVAGSTGPGDGGGPAAGAPTIFSGNGQMVFKSSPGTYPLVAIVKDATGKPVSGQPVTWKVTSGGLTLFNLASTDTDSNGKSQVTFLGATSFNTLSIADKSVVTATTPTGTATFYVTSVNTGINTSLVSPPLNNRVLSGKIGQKLVGAIRVSIAPFSYDTNTLSNVSVDVSTNLLPGTGPTVQCVGGYVLTDSTGNASCDLLIGGTPGTAQLTVTVGGVLPFLPFPITVTAGDPALLTPVSGNNFVGAPGQTVTLTGLVSDAGGNVLIGTPVTWELVTGGTGTLSKTSDTSDSFGHVSTALTLGNVAGPLQVRLRSGSSSYVFTATVNLPVTTTVTKVDGDNQTAELNTVFAKPLTVKVIDSNNNPVSGAAVDFSVTSGVAFVSLSRVITDPNGQATITVTAASVVGPITLKAANGASSVTFSLNVVPPGPTITAFFDVASFKSAITPGALARLTGTNIVPNIVGSVFGGSIVGGLPYTLNDVSIDVGGIRAPIYAVSNVNNEQSVTFQVPFEVPAGPVTITLTAPSGTATSQQVIQAYAPGLFMQNRPDGVAYAIVMRPNGSFVSPENPAVLGETLTTFASGLGATSPVVGTNQAGVGGQTVIAPLIVGANHAGMVVLSAQYAQNLIGVYEITFILDARFVNAGTDVPFQIAVRTDTGTINSNDTVLPLVSNPQ